MRLNRFLALCGVASRRKSDRLIQEGKVILNGAVCTNIATNVTLGKDFVHYNNKKLVVPEFLYYAFHKPSGYLTTREDPRCRPHIYALLGSIKARVFHVGRLDADSEGLLLLTNDGKLAYRLLHPKYKVPKVYYVEVNKALRERHCVALYAGISFTEGCAKAKRIEILENTPDLSRLRITLLQGMNRQIRRMFEALGIKVLYLRREAFGAIRLDIPLGSYRPLLTNELLKLQRQVSL